MGGSLCNRPQSDHEETSEKKEVNNWHTRLLGLNTNLAAIIGYTIIANTAYASTKYCGDETWPHMQAQQDIP